MEISALFQGPIDLHIPANRNVLIQFIEDSPLVDPDLRLNAREILDCFLACLSDKVSVQSILGLDGGYISVSIDNCRDSLGLPLQDFLRTGFLLMQLSNCRGFQKLISGFHNSTRQFASTRFEVESAFYCYTRPTFQYLELDRKSVV